MDRNKMRPIQWTVNIAAHSSTEGKATNETYKGYFHKWINRGNEICAIIEDTNGNVHFITAENQIEFRFTDKATSDETQMIM